jgi:hypothetical protein
MAETVITVKGGCGNGSHVLEEFGVAAFVVPMKGK